MKIDKIVLSKMNVALDNEDVKYSINDININNMIGQKISMYFNGILICKSCKKPQKKFYGQGLCYVCSRTSAINSPCIIHPELCEAHLGKGRDIEWEIKNHMTPHIVYVANSGDYKIGVTRADQIPTRWIDQGANQAVIIAKTPYRKLAGEIEVFYKDFIGDKTHWLKMLRTDVVVNDDILNLSKTLQSKIPIEYQDYMINGEEIYNIKYPLEDMSPDQKIASLKLDKNPIISKVLLGIKGQYLIFEDYSVINIRSHEGYEVSIQLMD